MMSRRFFLSLALVSVAGYGFGGTRKVFGSQGLAGRQEKILKLYNIHTGEKLRTRYWLDGEYVNDEINRIHHFLRCHFTNKIKPISTKVIDFLWDITKCVNCNREINIISGYRSPEYNEYLRRMGRGVSENSLHLEGLALDFAIPGVKTETLASAAVKFQAGGVGLYPDFVHIDVGRVRRW